MTESDENQGWILRKEGGYSKSSVVCRESYFANTVGSMKRESYFANRSYDNQ